MAEMESYLRNIVQEGAWQISDPIRILKPHSKNFDLTSLFQCQQHPIAQRYLQAIQYIKEGFTLISQYGKTTVDTIHDCDSIQPAFKLLVNAHMSENSMFPQEIGEPIISLVDQYLLLKPDDFLTKYLKWIITYRSESAENTISELSNYEKIKMVIRIGEILAKDLRTCKTQTPELRDILIDLYFIVGSKYGITGQKERALDTYEKCYKLDKVNYYPLYFFAYYNMEIDPEKAKLLFKEYLKIAPRTDKLYPNAYYMLASLFASEGNFEEAFRYTELAERAEAERLPFLQPVRVPQKELMKALKSFKNAPKK